MSRADRSRRTLTHSPRYTPLDSHCLSVFFLSFSVLFCTVADSVASVGESGDQDGYLGASVDSLGINTRP